MSNIIACAVCTDDDFLGARLAAKGRASWEIIKVSDGISKAGNPTAPVVFKVTDSTGQKAFVFWTVPMHVKGFVAKIASATGTSEMAKAGNMDIDAWLGKTGFGEIDHEESTGYPKKAVWKRFLKEGDTVTPAAPTAIDPSFNDTIPF